MSNERACWKCLNMKKFQQQTLENRKTHAMKNTIFFKNLGNCKMNLWWAKVNAYFQKSLNISFWPRISEIKYNEFPILAVFQLLISRFTRKVIGNGPPYPIFLFYYIFLEISEIFSSQHVKPPKIKLLVYHGSAQWSNLCYQGFIMDLKLNNCIC